MASVNERLTRLERRVTPPYKESPCSECGIAYGAEDSYSYEVVAFGDIPEPEPPCPRCSLPHTHTVVLDWDVIPGTLREGEPEEIDELEDQLLRKEIEWE